MSCPMTPCDAVAKRFEYHYAAVLDMYGPGIAKSHSAIVWLIVPVTTSRSAIYSTIFVKQVRHYARSEWSKKSGLLC